MDSFRIIITSDSGQEQTALIEAGQRSPLRVGRAPENNVQAISPYVSRVHAELSWHPAGVVFRDLGSTSGSYLNGAQVNEAVLRPGMRVLLGGLDGLPLSVEPAPVFEELPAEESGDWAVGGETRVLRVVDLASSPYLDEESGEIDSLASLSLSAPIAALGPERGDASEARKVAARLRALISLTGDLVGVRSGNGLASILVERTLDLLGVHRGMVLLLNERGELEPCAWGTREESGRKDIGQRPKPLDDSDEHVAAPGSHIPFRPIRTVVDQVMAEGVGVLSLDAGSDARFENSESLMLQAVRSILAVPIASGTRAHGVLYLDTKTTMDSDADALDFLVAVGHQAGIVMEHLRLVEQQQRMLDSLIKTLAASIDARDRITAGHSHRVAKYALGIAQAMGWDDERCQHVHYAGLLHDYGKIGVDDAVLRKPGSLTAEEYALIQKHPEYSYQILSKIHWPDAMKNLALEASSHHERMDGAGYPDRLAGEAIPIIGRIIAVADVYDALTWKRHYRDPMPEDEVLAHLEKGRGDRFDPQVLDAFFRYHRQSLEDSARRKEERRASVGLDAAGAPDATLTEDPDEVQTVQRGRPAPAPPVGLGPRRRADDNVRPLLLTPDHKSRD